MAIYNFSRDFQVAVCEALGIDLSQRRVIKLRLEMEVNQPVTLYIEEYANFSDGQQYRLASLLELATFIQPQPRPQLTQEPNNED